MNIDYKSGKVVSVTIELDNGAQFTGKVNIVDFPRFSDFIENYTAKHLRLFDVRKESDMNDALKKFVLIPKSKIIFYEPFDEE